MDFGSVGCMGLFRSGADPFKLAHVQPSFELVFKWAASRWEGDGKENERK